MSTLFIEINKNGKCDIFEQVGNEMCLQRARGEIGLVELPEIWDLDMEFKLDWVEKHYEVERRAIAAAIGDDQNLEEVEKDLENKIQEDLWDGNLPGKCHAEIWDVFSDFKEIRRHLEDTGFNDRVNESVITDENLDVMTELAWKSIVEWIANDSPFRHYLLDDNDKYHVQRVLEEMIED